MRGMVNRLAITCYPCYYVIVIVSFANQGTEDVFNGMNSRSARQCCPQSIWKTAQRKLDQLDSVTTLQDLRIPPGNHLEKRTGNREGQHSIRINDRYRICFIWTEAGPDEVEIEDYH